MGGSGVGYPITGPSGSPISPSGLTEPLPYTHLSLSRFARIMGISPAHFFGGTAVNLNPQIFPVRSCSGVWQKYSWQDADRVSRFDIAVEIANAEREISEFMGYWPSPRWITEEKHVYPSFHRPEYRGTGTDVSGRLKAIDTSTGKVIEGGRRGVTLLGSATVSGSDLSYSDEDGDGYYETATVAVNTSYTDINELKVYHTGYGGAMEWEIRHPRKKEVSGGVATFIFDSWLFIDPELYEAMPDEDGPNAIDISDTSNLVVQVDIYREYTDTTQAAAVFRWEYDPICSCCSGSGCEICSDTTQNGCLAVRNSEVGLVAPMPGSYDSDSGVWLKASWTASVEPHRVDLWYKAGLISDAYKRGISIDPLPIDIARVIARLATSRLERNLCGCSNVQMLSEYLRTDTTRTSSQGTFTFVTPGIVENPFGTRVGEVEAYRFVTKGVRKKRSSYAIF